MICRRKALHLKLLSLASNIALGLGLFLPCLIIHPNMGDYQAIIDLFKPDLSKTKSFSIFSGIVQLLKDGDIIIALIIFIFSFAFPIWKACVTWNCILGIEKGIPIGKLMNFASNLGKLSMVDVLVIAIFIVAIKGLPGNTKCEVGSGLIAFTTSVLLGIWLSVLVKKTSGKTNLNDETRVIVIKDSSGWN